MKKALAVLMILALPSIAYSHGLPPLDEPLTIIEAYGEACAAAIHEHFNISSGHGDFELTHGQDMPHIAAHIVQSRHVHYFWAMYREAHRYQDAGYLIEIRAAQLARGFRFSHQGVCDHG